MPTVLTQLQVYNLAFDWIKEPAAPSLATESAAMRVLNRNWEITIDTLLEQYPWDFAKERHILSQDPTAPTFNWTRRFPVPPDIVRILPITEFGKRNGQIVQYEMIGGFIETDHESPLYITAIRRIHEPGEWSSLFTNMVSLALATKLVAKFAAKRQYASDISSALQQAQAVAERMDAFSGTPDPIESHDVIRVRGR